MKKLLLWIALIQFSSSGLAEDLEPVERPNSGQQITMSQEYYKKLYENEVRSNAQIIETMQWSIALITGFILLTLGSQIFYSTRINKEEINNIKKGISEHFIKLKNDTDNFASKREAEYSEKLEDIKKKSIENLTESFSEKFQYFKNNIQKDIDNNSGKIDALDEHSSSVVKEIKQNLTELEAQVWKLRGVETNALRSFLSSAEITIERGHEEQFILNDIIKALESMDSIAVDDYKKAKSLLSNVNKSNDSLKSRISTLCEDLPQYMFVEDPRKKHKLIRVPLSKQA